MPLHLLGKKSWNVYNAANVERVRRDEAAARACEEASEQRMQEADAARRLAILRGEVPPPLPSPSPPAADLPGRASRDATVGFLREKRKRKRAGEDDTDFEMRVAREEAEAGGKARTELLRSRNTSVKTGDIVGKDGHIDLFGEEVAAQQQRGEKSAEAEAEKAKKRRDEEDQYTLRFANAAGRGRQLLSSAGPWYAKSWESAAEKEADVETPGKDAWGNEDPERRRRDAARMQAGDPLAMMKTGARKVREIERDRKREADERERELRELRREERRSGRKRRRRGESGEDGNGAGELEGFSLDAPQSRRREQEPGRQKDRADRGLAQGHRDNKWEGEEAHRWGRRNDDAFKHESRRRHHHRELDNQKASKVADMAQ
ncbi:hypothetical protein NKR23_g4001 [Pleurostoma richardsiae]|uniref:CBF1-interacting co-repressor CIR N-terminal domain-containing protein n=1 Tax=Pleurostoma richardsiae TaxID=41990 RepID=A0AA38RJR2_9PEZI|nr:hypothetical protein NKR23_g4001 [Pleurostoma richardsiae]